MQKTNHTNRLPQTRDAFQSLIQRLFGDALPEFFGPSDGGSATVSPRTNISESDQSYELSFELPGLDEKDIQVNVQDGMLTVTAERKDTRESKERRWHRVEHHYGQFSRTISLPNDVSPDAIDAVYKQGVLTVTLQKAPESQPARIQVRGG